jgi:Concanavalin A-like lectin/glucanases superfamily
MGGVQRRLSDGARRQMGEGIDIIIKTVSDQYCLVLEGETLLTTEKKEWNKKEMKAFCFEMWFNTEDDKGILLSTSDEKVMLMFKLGKLSCIINKHKLAADVDHNIKKCAWNHVALSINCKESTILLFLNGKIVMSSSDLEINLKKIGRNYLMVVPQFKGKVTEIRLWKRSKDLYEIKSNLSTPLSVVGEQSVMVVINIKEAGTERVRSASPAKDIDFDFGDVIATPVAGGMESWNFSQADGWGDQAKQVEEVLVAQRSVSDNVGIEENRGSSPDINKSEIGKGEINEWDIELPKESLPKLEKGEQSVKHKDTLGILNIFSSFKFIPSIQVQDNLDSMYQSQFASISNQKAFLQKLSSLLMNIVKKSRSFYFRDDFSPAIQLVERVFEQTKEVSIY